MIVQQYCNKAPVFTSRVSNFLYKLSGNRQRTRKRSLSKPYGKPDANNLLKGRLLPRR